MPRITSRIPTGIWDDPQFTGLVSISQWLYLVLLTQPETSPAGVLPLRPRRWSGRSRTATIETVESALEDLTQRCLLLIDEDTEEVLVTEFMSIDGALANAKRRTAIRAALDDIDSPYIRDAVCVQLDTHPARLGSTSPGALATARLRLAVYRNGNFTCQRCGWRPDVPDGYDGRLALDGVAPNAAGVPALRLLELDHVHPRSRGGRTTLANLQPLCNLCNARKGASV